jgi:hypothetical protein
MAQTLSKKGHQKSTFSKKLLPGVEEQTMYEE